LKLFFYIKKTFPFQKFFVFLQPSIGRSLSAGAGMTFVGKTLALAIIQSVPKLAGRKNKS